MAAKRAYPCNLSHDIPIPSYGEFVATESKVHYEFFVGILKQRNKAYKAGALSIATTRIKSRDKSVADVDSKRRKRIKTSADPELNVPFYLYEPPVAGPGGDASNEMIQFFELTADS
jgi:hypothetical protein